MSEINEDDILAMNYDQSWLKQAGYSLACNGALFDNKKEGSLSHIVASIFAKRKEYKILMKLAEKEGNDDLIKKYDTFQ
jgi:hypothetical protein